MALEGKGGRPPGYPKTGGRQKGSPNKATLDVAEKLDALGCDPIEGLAKIAMDGKNTTEIRARCFIELAQYLHPKRKPVDVSIERETVTNVITTLDTSPKGSDDGNQPAFKP
jgi:hypothetical protein